LEADSGKYIRDVNFAKYFELFGNNIIKTVEMASIFSYKNSNGELETIINEWGDIILDGVSFSEIVSQIYALSAYRKPKSKKVSKSSRVVRKKKKTGKPIKKSGGILDFM